METKRAQSAGSPITAAAEAAQPTVSIVICNYNYARYLERAITSALQQTQACEVVVVDDGSTDDSRAVLARFRQDVRVVEQPNGGQRRAYESGIAHARGAIVLFLDADDYLLPEAVRIVAAAFDEGVAKVHFRLQLVDENDRALGATIPKRLSRGDVRTSLLRDGLLYASSPGSGNAYRRSAIEPLFPLPCSPTDRHGADFFLIYGSIVRGEVRAVDAVLGAYRVHERAASEFVFGNAAAKVDPRVRFERRCAQLREWLRERTAGEVELPGALLDFSQAKLALVTAVFGTRYFAGVRAGAQVLPGLLTALWLDRDFGVLAKMAATGWSVGVLVAPRSVARGLARYGANPASRPARTLRFSQQAPGCP